MFTIHIFTKFTNRTLKLTNWSCQNKLRLPLGVKLSLVLLIKVYYIINKAILNNNIGSKCSVII